MMSIPFLGVFLALVLAAGRLRGVAALVLLLSLAATLVLLRLHATDPIAIDL